MFRAFVDRPAGDSRPGDIDMMRFVLEIDDDENVFRPGYEDWPEQLPAAEVPVRKVERAPWLPPKDEATS